MRLFVAITLPEAVREFLTGLTNGLPGARWVPPENIHLTLRFIGDVDGHQAHDIDEALSGIRMPGFDLSLSGVGNFGDVRKLRVLWAGVDPNPELVRLHDKVEQSLIRAGLEPDIRKFKPHITLARFKPGAAAKPGPKLHEFLSSHALYRSETFPVDHFTLYSSFLSSSGSIYKPEADYELERGG